MTNKDCPDPDCSPDRHRADVIPSVSLTLLQTVIDAIPEATWVIDLDYRIVLANRAARQLAGTEDPVAGRLPCYQVSHHRDSPCQGNEEPCPLTEVVAARAPVTVVHTHFDAAGHDVFVEITAAPIFDEAGEVVQIVESCRDITERKRIRRLLEIGNRHMAMKPMLDEFVEEIVDFAHCTAVGIRILDERGHIDYHAQEGLNQEFYDLENSLSINNVDCRCVDVVLGHTDSSRASCTEGGSYYTNSTTRMPTLCSSDEKQQRCSVCNLFGFESVALVPIRLGSKTLGLIHVADQRENVVPLKMVEELERMAMQLGTAIQRVRAEESLRAAHDELEDRVQQRTEELARINEDLQTQIAERRQLEQEVLEVSMREQQRIGQELHDGIGQELTGLGYLAKSLHQRLQAQASPQARKAAELVRGIPGVLNQIQKIVKDLVPMEIGGDALLPALQAMAANLEERSGVSCRVENDRPIRIRDDDTAIHLYRIAQEAVNNAVKHGKPRHIVLALEEHDGQTGLRVHDDGVGMHVGAERTSGSGLRIMRYRASVIGAVVDVRPAADGGTLVICTLPREKRDD